MLQFVVRFRYQRKGREMKTYKITMAREEGGDD